MLSVVGPFKLAFRIATKGKKSHTITRLGTSPLKTGSIGLAKTNYFRNLRVVEEIGMDGYAFMLLKSDLDAISGFGAPVKGDVIEHSNFGTLTVNTVDAIEDGDTVFAYRITTV